MSLRSCATSSDGNRSDVHSKRTGNDSPPESRARRARVHVRRVAGSGLAASCRPTTRVGVENELADPNGLRGDLDALVLAAELEALLEGQLARRDQLLEVVRAGRAYVGLLLLLGDVHVHVVGARVLTDDHALVELGGRLHEQGAALLQVRHGVSGGGATPVRDERAGASRA